MFGAGRAVTSGKGVTGHLIGAAGSVEAVAALLAANRGLVPPTANHVRTDLPVDVVTGWARAVGSRRRSSRRRSRSAGTTSPSCSARPDAGTVAA